MEKNRKALAARLLATTGFFALLTAASMVNYSCNGCKNTPSATDTTATDTTTLVADSDTIPPVNQETSMVGTVEEATMHALLLLTDDNAEVQMELMNGNVVGAVEEGDRVYVVYNEKEGEYQAVIAVNLSSLQHLWAIRTGDMLNRLELNANGKAITYGMVNSKHYDSWAVSDGMLLLHASEDLAREQSAPADTFQISLLTTDSLILFNQKTDLHFRREN